ncbi:MAG: SPOR domain-containing protein, partial [Nitrospinae bacterium]|nr:SPOR domain-containing protein [Nitrospinota bacterium]
GLITDSQNEKKTSPPKDIINQTAERPTQREALKTAKPAQPNKSTGIPTALSQDVKKEFTVQVSSFQERDRARDMRGRLSKKGYPAFYLKVDIPEKGVWYRVYLGTYSTRQEAKMAAGRANIKENLPAVVRQTG